MTEVKKMLTAKQIAEGAELWIVRDPETDDMEIFSERPKSPGVGGHHDNWPDEYRVYVACVDGGDSLKIEEKNSLGEVWVINEDDHRYWRQVG